MLITCALCGHQEPHHARSLCRRCYNKVYACALILAFPCKAARDRRQYWREWKRQARAHQNTLASSQKAR
jgi:NMD protein affecting ribosome stability and mRNA decay